MMNVLLFFSHLMTLCFAFRIYFFPIFSDTIRIPFYLSSLTPTSPFYSSLLGRSLVTFIVAHIKSALPCFFWLFRKCELFGLVVRKKRWIISLVCTTLFLLFITVSFYDLSIFVFGSFLIPFLLCFYFVFPINSTHQLPPPSSLET